MRYVRGFVHFWYDFIVGDDWKLAVGAVAAIALAYAAAHRDLTAWWVLPVAVSALLSVSLWHATRQSSTGQT
jgi:hypothetical protein